MAVEIEAENSLNTALKSLQTLTGDATDGLADIDGKRLPVQQKIGEVEEWLARAMESNPSLLALNHEVDAAKQEVSKARGGHYPTLDLVATHKEAQSETVSTIDSSSNSDFVGLELNVPLFAGGGVAASVRQAKKKEEQVAQKLEAARRTAELTVQREYGNLKQNASKVAALHRALDSAKLALTGTEKGVTAGTRTTIDVVNAQDLVFKTVVDLARVRYLYVLSFLKLNEVAGSLNEETMQLVNQWLRHG
jgi:outer membrane protein/protease secretion system outer membrane protein